jgi:hypothetical protein
MVNEAMSWTIETLHSLMDREDGFLRSEISAERRIIEGRFDAIDKATKLETTELSRRLGDLNHAHELARQKEVDFIGREAFNTFVTRTADDFLVLRKEINVTANSVTTAREQSANALATSLSEQAKLGEARFARIEKSQSMMLGALMLVAAIIPVITALVVHFMGK